MQESVVTADQYWGNLTDKCVPEFFEPISKGLELVFGGKPSVGFICGVRDAIVDDGKQIPGTCCLDAPFQLDGDNWGNEYKCSFECKRVGPYFSGMSAEACDAHGGTFCPNPADCSRLKDCLANQEVWAGAEQELGFLKYLQTAPKIHDAENVEECGQTREYFGFLSTFMNDDQICEDVEQLRFSDDFAFLNEFLGQGSPDEDDSLLESGEQKGDVPPLVLQKPSRKASSTDNVQNAGDWEKTNFGLEQVLSASEAFRDAMCGDESPPCPDLPFVGTFPCELVKYVLCKVSGLVFTAMQTSHAVSVFQFESNCLIGNDQEIEAYENTAAVYNNMEKTATYLQERFQALGEEVAQIKAVVEDAGTARKLNQVADLVADVAEIKDALQDASARRRLASFDDQGSAFEIQMSVVSSKPDPLSFVCLFTQQGAPVRPHVFELTGLNTKEMALVPITTHNTTELGVGKMLVQLQEDADVKTIFLKAGLVDHASSAILAEKELMVSYDG